jgi:aldehyde:ferredoxin oxidoreductase
MLEQHEIACYRGLLRDVQSVDSCDDDQIQDLIETMYGYAEIGHITADMHQELCKILADRTTPSEFA